MKELSFDVVEKILRLCDEHNYSLYRLAKEAGLPESTVRNMKTKHTIPTIYTLKVMCCALGISLSEFFGDNTSLTRDEAKLLSIYRVLTPERRQSVNDFSHFLLKQEQDARREEER